jgi:Icc protein
VGNSTTRQDSLGRSAAAPPLAERHVLQLSDPHLLVDPAGRHRGVAALPHLVHGLEQALAQLSAEGLQPDALLLSGDLCQDESWGGYVRLAELLRQPAAAALGPALLLAGNHDHPQLLRASLGRQARIAPGLWPLGGPGSWSLLALDSHCSGREGGRLEAAQWRWLEGLLQEAAAPEAAAPAGPLLVALHHPPLPLGDPFFDAIGLEEGERLLALLARSPRVRGVVFGHGHQHWQGTLPGRPEVPLLGCPSTLSAFTPVQPCPLGRGDAPGGRLLSLTREGGIRHRLLRWDPLGPP